MKAAWIITAPAVALDIRELRADIAAALLILEAGRRGDRARLLDGTTRILTPGEAIEAAIIRLGGEPAPARAGATARVLALFTPRGGARP